MNIFGGRPGITAGVLAVIATLAAFYFISAVAIALLLTAIVICLMLCVLCACGYIKPYRLFASVFVIAVFGTSLVRASSVFERDLPTAAGFAGEGKYVHATVTERQMSADYYSVFVLRLHSIDGVKYEEKALLNCEYNSLLQVGYEIVLRGAEVTPSTALPENDAYDLISENIYLSILHNDENDCAVLSKNNLSFVDRCRALNTLCAARLKNSIKGDGGRLAAAMLLGSKSDLPSELYRDFTRAGLSHYLAVSGLHVSIITGAMSFFLMKLRIRRRYRNILMSLFSIGYLCLLGFPISAVRSVIMLLTMFIAYSLGDNSDAISSLGLAAAGITIYNPCAAFDESFILSFCATLGIVVFMPAFYDLTAKIFESKRDDEAESKKKGRWAHGKAFGTVFGTLMSISAALSLTLLPVMCFFGEVSILSFRSNLVTSIAAIPVLAASLLFLFAGGIPFIGRALASVISISAKYMISVASRLSETRGALVSLTYKETKVVVLVFSVVLIFFMVIKLKRKILLTLLALYPMMLALFVLISVGNRPQNPQFEIISFSQSETISIVSGGEAAIIDISEGYLSSLRIAYELMNESGVCEIDTLMLTHYHSKHLSSVSRFMAEVKVRRLLLPQPQNESDAWIMAQLAESAVSLGVQAELIPDSGVLEIIDEVLLDFSGIERLERSNSPVFYMSLSCGNKRITYISESSWECGGEFREGLCEQVRDAEYLLIGEQGPVAKSAFDIFPADASIVALLGNVAGIHLVGEVSALYQNNDSCIIEVGVCHKIISFDE